MELKPGHKQTMSGIIPEEWAVSNFANFIEFKNGVNAEKQAYGKGIPFINVLEVLNSAHIYSSEIQGKVTLSKESIDLYLVRKGDIVFNRTSETQDEVGLASVYMDDARVVFGGFVIRGRPKLDTIDPIYSGYALRSPAIRSQVVAMGQGVIRANISQAELRKVRVTLPPLLEQRAIAAALSDTDALLSSIDRLLAKKQDIKQAIVQQLLTGTHRLPGFRGEWEEKQFGDLASPRRDRVDPKRSAIFDFCIEMEHIEQGTGRLIASTGKQTSLKSIFQPGDVLFGKLRAYLRKYWLADRQGVCSTEIWCLVPNSKLLISTFLFQVVKSDAFIDAASTAYGTHMPRSDWSVVKNLEILIPRLDEQAAIAAVLSDMDAEIDALQRRRDKIRAVKQGMMQELLTGRTRLV